MNALRDETVPDPRIVAGPHATGLHPVFPLKSKENPVIPADPLAEPLQVAGADGQPGQLAQVLARLLERRRLGGLSHGLAQGRGAVPLGAQAELMVEGGKTRPDRPCM